MKQTITPGTTSFIDHFKALDSTSTTGAGKTGLVFGDFTVWCLRSGGTAAQLTPIVITTLGTWDTDTISTKIAIKLVSDANLAGWYEFHLPNDILVTGATSLKLQFRATGMVPVDIEYQFVADQPDEDDVRATVVYDLGRRMGNMTLPPVGKTELSYQYGANGTEFTGTGFASSLPTPPVNAPVFIDPINGSDDNDGLSNFAHFWDCTAVWNEAALTLDFSATAPGLVPTYVHRAGDHIHIVVTASSWEAIYKVVSKDDDTETLQLDTVPLWESGTAPATATTDVITSLPCKTLQVAIEAIANLDGGTIFLEPGSHRVSFSVGLILHPANGSTEVVTSPGREGSPAIVDEASVLQREGLGFE